MPKKTRKQKVAAEKRNHQAVKASIANTPVSKKNVIQVENSTLSTAKTTKIPLFEHSTNQFSKELYKSIGISAIILLIEFGLYLAQLSGITINKFL